MVQLAECGKCNAKDGLWKLAGLPIEASSQVSEKACDMFVTQLGGVLLAIENYGIFDPIEVGRDSAPTVAPDTHEVFDGAEEGRSCHGGSLILDTDQATIPVPVRPGFSRITGPMAFFIFLFGKQY